MIEANIFDGDVLVVNGSIEAKNGDIVIALVITPKRWGIRIIRGKTYLYPANKDYPVIPIKENTKLHIWGVVQKKIGEGG